MSTKIIENATIGHDKISHMPMFGIQRFREFMNAPRVWGKDKDSVYWDDVLIHIRDNDRLYSFSNEETGYSTNPLNEDFLENFSDKAIIYIETGSIQASQSSNKTRFVRVSDSDDFDSKNWSNDLASVVQAWDVDFYQDLKIEKVA